MIQIGNNDCLLWLDKRAENSIDAIVTDPPYELGFMAKQWDSTGIAYSVDFWRKALRALKPGGHLLAFGGTRTYHRMACAIEDAGFEIRDSLHWIYGTGFPKSLNLGDGRGTALKPGHEPILLARKPLEGTVAANVTRYGTGALNIDGCRIAHRDDVDLTAMQRCQTRQDGHTVTLNVPGFSTAMYKPAGRWPANVLLDDSAAEHEWARYFYVAKPSRKERDLGCESLPIKTASEALAREPESAGLNSARAGAGRNGGMRNFHPTVKPIELMRYLIKLVTPPGGIVLDPFLGSGTTGLAAKREGVNFIGLEKEKDYFEIAKARIEHG